MKIIKYLETRLNITNNNDIFCTDYENMIISLLKKKFINRCYKSVYIIDILSILRRGNINCQAKSLDGGLYVDVQFKAECIVYEKGEILQNCKVVQVTDKDIILAKSKHCSIQIKNIMKIDIFKENDEIPIIVQATRYNLFDTEIAISSIPLVPIVELNINYKITESTLDKSDFTEDQEEEIVIKELEKKISEFNNKAVKFFVELIYPYKSYKDYKKIANKTKISNYSSVKVNDVVFIGDKYLNEDIFYIYNNNDNEGDIEISKQELYYKIILDYKKRLCNLLGFLENYDIEKIKNNATLWKVYNSLKK